MNTTQADVQRIQTRLQALSQNRRMAPSSASSQSTVAHQSTQPESSNSRNASQTVVQRSVMLPSASSQGSRSTARTSSPSSPQLSAHEASLASPVASPSLAKEIAPASTSSVFTSSSVAHASPSRSTSSLSGPAEEWSHPVSSAHSLHASHSGSSYTRAQPVDSQHHAAQYLKSQQPEVQSSGAASDIDESFRRLDVQVQQVNSMSLALEAALQETAAIAQQLNQQRIRAAARGQRTRFDHWNAPLVYDPRHIRPEQSYLPHIDRSSQGEFVLTGRPLSWTSNAQASAVEARATASQAMPSDVQSKYSTANHDVGAIAASLRHRSVARKHHSNTARSPQSQILPDWIVRWFNPSHTPVSLSVAAPQSASSLKEKTVAPTTTARGVSAQHPLPHQVQQPQPQQAEAFAPSLGSSFNRSANGSPAVLSGTIPGALLFIGVAAIARIGMDWLLVSYPMLWPVVIALVITPAAIAIYRSTVAPKASFAMGRQLLLVMIGLLIGGRF